MTAVGPLAVATLEIRMKMTYFPMLLSLYMPGDEER